MTRIQLNFLPTFVAVAQLENLRAAAEALHLTHSAVSQQIGELENRLGFPLFDRRGRRIHLNAAGQALLRQAAPALALVEDGGYALVFDANGTQLRVQRVEAVAPHPYTALGWEVDDVAVQVRALAANGVVTTRFPGLPQDADGVWVTPDGSRVAWFQDPDGNTLSISQPPPAA